MTAIGSATAIAPPPRATPTIPDLPLDGFLADALDAPPNKSRKWLPMRVRPYAAYRLTEPERNAKDENEAAGERVAQQFEERSAGGDEHLVHADRSRFRR
jgi:hypothetical protein